MKDDTASMSEAANMPENKLIDGRYRIVRKIADGGMATVYQAVDVRLGRDVALKIMHIQLAQGPHRDQFVERFRREANSAAAIANPHVVQVYDTGENDGLDYLVMEYVHGVNLRHEMQTKRTFSVRAGRSFTSRFVRYEMNRATCGSIPVQTVATDGTFSFTCLNTMVTGLSARNGTCPVSISHAMMPTE